MTFQQKLGKEIQEADNLASCKDISGEQTLHQNGNRLSLVKENTHHRRHRFKLDWRRFESGITICLKCEQFEMNSING